MPASVLVETAFLIERPLRSTAEDDLARMAELVCTYDDLLLGAVEASIIAIAERLRIPAIATIDELRRAPSSRRTGGALAAVSPRERIAPLP